MIDGSLPHEKVYGWYDGLDVYIQPSFQEGLCRSIIEAMSRALPVTCSDAGGNWELVDKNMIFRAGNVGQIADDMQKMLDPAVRERELTQSFRTAQDFSKEKLDAKRRKFYTDFTGVTE